MNDPRFMSLQSWIKTGDIVGVDFCYHELPDKLDVYDNDAFLRCGVPFYATCTNVETGKAEHIRITDMRRQIDVLRASASLPYFSRIMELDRKKYPDGGCADSVPVEAFQAMGYKRNVVVLTQPASYHKEPKMQLLPKLVYRKYPALVKTLEERRTRYNAAAERIRGMEKEGTVFIIQPQGPLNIGRLEKDPEKVQHVYDIGRSDAQRVLPQLKIWLAGANEKRL